MKIPTNEQIAVATWWLGQFEGDEADMEACKATVAWLEHMNREEFIRQVAHTRGVSTASVRRAVAEAEAAK